MSNEMVDFAAMELRVMAALNIKTNEEADKYASEDKAFLESMTPEQRRFFKAYRFGKVYGRTPEEIAEAVSDVSPEERRRAVWKTIKTFPGFLGYNRLRKSRARMMAEAVKEDRVEKGNVGVRIANSDPNVFFFSYRGTDIMCWHVLRNEITDVHAGAFNDTPSTRNQRKMVREAVEEFNKAVFG